MLVYQEACLVLGFSSIHMHWVKLQMWENLGIPGGPLFGNTTDQKCSSAQLVEETEQKGQEGKSHCPMGSNSQGVGPEQLLHHIYMKITNILARKGRFKV